MANPWAGEVELVLGGMRHKAKLTLGALAALEAELVAGSLIELVERFDQGRFSARDVVMVLRAGLRASGWSGDGAELDALEGGPLAAARLAAQLLARAFALPDAG